MRVLARDGQAGAPADGIAAAARFTVGALYSNVATTQELLLARSTREVPGDRQSQARGAAAAEDSAGAIRRVIGMVEAEAYCPEVMKQVAALQASLKKVNRVLLRNHLETCVTEAIRTGQGEEKIADLMEALPYSSGLTDFRHQVDPLPLPASPDGAAAANGTARGGRARR